MYKVHIIYRGARTFTVKASSPDKAVELAKEKFLNGDTSDQSWDEWEDIEDNDPPVKIKEK
jgi:hypothetical protein